MSKQQNNARRQLLKAVVVGGGAVTTVTSLPQHWTKPVLDHVVLPAHAQTSVIAGVFTATNLFAFNTLGGPQRGGIQYALLDMLISPANAGHIVDGICTNEMSPATLIIRINADGTVDVAVSTNQADESPCGATSTVINGNQIADVSVPLDLDEFFDLSNMTATPTQVTGSWRARDTADADATECNAAFTAPLGGTFPATNICVAD